MVRVGLRVLKGRKKAEEGIMGTPRGAVLGFMPEWVGSGGRSEAYFIGQPACRKLITDF
jgi:hypothetical protein